ncbi:hypothetical protein N657DRAFT_650997 [Parathielavia appendiculata]|uniref:Uncharacterized protein n=1 Tax=Parathielavia appendiculata TaxID=2587402 RepID=A0AAN6YYU4_9PEZI|nr:hypothetical protein N657DRAFT_650997 [Parathielavia appendiculata]
MAMRACLEVAVPIHRGTMSFHVALRIRELEPGGKPDEWACKRGSPSDSHRLWPSNLSI